MKTNVFACSNVFLLKRAYGAITCITQKAIIAIPWYKNILRYPNSRIVVSKSSDSIWDPLLKTLTETRHYRYLWRCKLSAPVRGSWMRVWLLLKHRWVEKWPLEIIHNAGDSRREWVQEPPEEKDPDQRTWLRENNTTYTHNRLQKTRHHYDLYRNSIQAKQCKTNSRVSTLKYHHIQNKAITWTYKS